MIEKDRFQRRQVEREKQEKLRKEKRRPSAKIRAARAADDEAERVRQERDKAAVTAIARSIIDKLSSSDLEFLVSTLSVNSFSRWKIVDELLRLAGPVSS